MELDDLKNIWKEKKGNNLSAEPVEYDGLIETLKKAEKNVIIRYIFMSIFMAITVGVFISQFFGPKAFNDLTYFGIYLLLTAMLLVFLMVWSTAIIMKKDNISDPGIDFLKSVRKKFNRRNMIRKIVIPIYLAAITIGVSLVYVEILSRYSLTIRILAHILVIVFIVTISVIASRQEKKRYEKTYKPIEARLDELLAEYEK